jgi:hypothetical protein
MIVQSEWQPQSAAGEACQPVAAVDGAHGECVAGRPRGGDRLVAAGVARGDDEWDMVSRGEGGTVRAHARTEITDRMLFFNRTTTSPAPDGIRHVGRRAVLDAWRRFLRARRPRTSRLKRCSSRVIGSSSGGSTAGRTGMSGALTCSGSGSGRWRRAWLTSRADRARRDDSPDRCLRQIRPGIQRCWS